MLHDIPKAILDRMKYLENIDARDRVDGAERLNRLRQIPPMTGRFIALMAASAPEGCLIEIGTSAGYSTLWLALAANQTSRKFITFEILEKKAALARETFKIAGVENSVELVEDDALKHIHKYREIAFCFLDAEKEIYENCFNQAVPNLVPGGFLIADNAISHKADLQPMIDRAAADKRVDSIVLPIGKGLLFCRKC